MIDATTRLVAPPDVEVTPVSEMEDSLREQLGALPGTFAVHRPLGRASPKLLSADLAALFERFAKPHTVPEAIVAFAAAKGLDASLVADESLESLVELHTVGFLVDADAPTAAALTAARRSGDIVGAFRVHSVVRVMDDVDVYQGVDAEGGRVALKVWREGGLDEAAHEARTLERLAGRLSPQLLAFGADSGLVYLATSWCGGIGAEPAASELQHLARPERRRRLLGLLATIAESYGELHALGVLHGDVHDENLLVDRDGLVRLLDFGQSTRMADGVASRPTHRGGYFRYFEPEYALARLSDTEVPHATAASEQYAMAAMFFHLFTGSHYLNFDAHQAGALLQIAEAPPLTFAVVGTEPWPELERILGRALAKAPAERHECLADMAQALRRLEESERRQSAVRTPRRTSADKRLRSFWGDAAPGGRLFERGFERAPTTSIAFGSAGVAYAVYRYALLTGSSDWLSVAAHWSDISLRQLRNRRAFHDDDELTPEVVGPQSVLNGVAGVHFVSALCANAMGDELTMREAVDSFLRVSRRKTANMDLVLGSAGEMLAISMLADMALANTWIDPARLVARARATARGIWACLDVCQPIERETVYRNLGISHGWGGIAYATLRLRRFGVSEFDTSLHRRLGELADCAEYAGRGVRWPWRDDGGDVDGGYASGWCNGSAGFAHLWLEARSLIGEAKGLELATAAGWNVLDATEDDVPGLCCGLAGGAYALLALYRTTGDAGWLARARDLSRRAALACSTEFPEYDSLFRGAPGVALVQAEMEAPHAARMPLFESEDWSDGG